MTEMRIAKYEVVRDRNIRVVLAIAPPYQPEARQVEKPTKPPEMPIGLSHKDVERCVGISGQSAAVQLLKVLDNLQGKSFAGFFLCRQRPPQL
jgi:hypothetical protein